MTRLAEVVALLVARQQAGDEAHSLCLVAAEVAAVDAAAVSLVSAEGAFTVVCCGTPRSRELMDAELTTGEGPCADAARTDRRVAEEDVRTSATSRWLGYNALAREIGVRGVFAVPVKVGAVRIGVLGLFCDEPGPLRDAQWSDVYLMATVVGRVVLALQAGAPPGTLAAALERDGASEVAVHWACGMVAVQGTMSVRDSLVILRSHAFATGVTLADLAARVVANETHWNADRLAWADGAW